MPLLVHLAPKKNVGAIRRSGIKSRRRIDGATFAMPVLKNFIVTHQWMRELRRRGQRSFCGVYFRIPDDEIVSLVTTTIFTLRFLPLQRLEPS
jgi:hypothetical protein